MQQSTTTQDDLWSAKLPNGEVRSGTLAQLSEAFKSGHVPGDTPVRSSASEQWAQLVDVLVWQVKLADGQVRSGTRQQLLDAFRAGHLDADMMVLAGGASEWVKLGTLMKSGAASVAPPAVMPAAVSVRPAPVAPAPPPAPAPTPVAVAPKPAVSWPPASRPAGDDAWQVRLPTGQIRSGTREQLEEAYRTGHLDNGALVLAAGATTWSTLGALFGAAAGAAAPAVAPAEPTPAAEPVIAAPPQAEVTTPPTEAPEESAAVHTNGVDQTPVTPPAADEGVPEPRAAAAEQPDWLVRLTHPQLEAAVRLGLLDPHAQVSAVGTDEWVALGDVLPAHS
jgi:hypothetical protein